MAHSPQQQQTELSDLGGLDVAVAAIAIAPSQDPEGGVYEKGPKRSEQVKKSDLRLRQSGASGGVGGGGSASQLSASLAQSYVTQQQQQPPPLPPPQPQYQQQYSCLISPVTSPSSQQAWTPAAPQSAQSQLEADDIDILQEIMDNDSFHDGSLALGGGGAAASHTEVIFYAPPAPPPPPPPPSASSSAGVASATARQSGPPVSDATRRALIQKLHPPGPQTPMVDENFNT